jgi:hypothetical protein
MLLTRHRHSSRRQVFNRFIPEPEIQKGLLDDVRSASSRKDSLTIEEYRRLYFKYGL